ncbi:MAG: ABC transporter substrate-binding protein [Dehalococcoidales bacterium]|nr:ABC transporter substrate-binding protein [Dehalococcoidales bacterium]
MEGDWAKGPAGSNESDWATASPIFKHLTGYLAESWETPDSGTIVWHIRKGVHWGLNPKFEASRLVNGRELTADDVVFSINAMYEFPGAPYKIRFTDVERPLSVTATDKYTVVVKVTPDYLSGIFQRMSSSLNILPRDVYEKYGDMMDWKTSVGTGAFMLEDVVENSSATFVRNPNYWQTDPVGPGMGQQLPYVDIVKMLIITDRSTRLAAFRTAKLDHLGGRNAGLGREEIVSLETTLPDLPRKGFPAYGYVVALRMDRPDAPWADIRVRQALNMAVNREEIVKDFYDGDANITNFPQNPFQVWVSMGVAGPLEIWPEVYQDAMHYQLEKAKQLMADAGYPNGFKIEVIIESLETRVDELTLIKEYWSKIGVDLDIQVRERGAYTSIAAGRTHKDAIYDSMGVSNYTWEEYRPDDSSNVGMIDDPFINKNILEFTKYVWFEDDKAYQIMKETLDYIVRQLWVVPFPAAREYTIWQPWLKNYDGEYMLGTTNQFGFTRFIWIDQALKKSLGF